MSLALLPLLGLSAASAAPHPGHGPAAHAPSTQLAAVDRDELWDAWFSVVDPSQVRDPASLEARARSLEDRGFHCLTEVMLQLDTRWHEFSPEEQALIEASRPQPVELEPEVLPEGVMAPAPASEPCFSVGWGNFVYGEHFAVEYEDGVSEADAQDFLDELEYSYGELFDTWDWKQPNGDTKYLVLAGIQNGGGAGAYTYYNGCSGAPGGWMPYIIAGEGSFSAGSWYKTMAGHELNHASQFGYGGLHEFFWWEATATWVEEYLYPPLNDWADMTYVYSQVPHIGLNASAGDSNNQWLFYHTYAMAVWGIYLDEYVGGHDFVRGTWEQAIDAYYDGGYKGYDYWMPEVIEDMGEDFDARWAEFLAVSTVAAFEESNYFYDPETEDEFSSLPASGDDSRSTRPQSLGANFWKFKGSVCDEGEALVVDFDGDGAVPWIVVLARAEDDELDEHVVLELDDNADGTGQINCDGRTDLYLVMSPKDEDASGYYYDWSDADDYSYQFSASAGEAEAGGGSGGGGGTGADGDDVDGAGSGALTSEDRGGCGCATPATAPAALAWLAGIGLIGLRRRRG